jgi:hypothetical protein
LIARLGAAVPAEPKITCIRIEVDLPPQLTDSQHTAVLKALSAADRYGHTLTSDNEFVWAEITQERRKV